MKHLFPAPDMKRGTHAREANRLVRPSHVLPGLLRSKATNVVICSVFACKRQVSSGPEPAFNWPPSSQQLPGALSHKESLSAKGDAKQQRDIKLEGLVLWPSAEQDRGGEQGGELVSWTPLGPCLQAAVPGCFPFLEGRYD